jgi:hypothetical protein
MYLFISVYFTNLLKSQGTQRRMVELLVNCHVARMFLSKTLLWRTAEIKKKALRIQFIRVRGELHAPAVLLQGQWVTGTTR